MNDTVKKLINTIQYTQRTEEWHSIRKTLITASSASSLLVRDKKTCQSYVEQYELEDIFDYNGGCCNPYSSRKQFILDKCKKNSFKGSIATFWGQTYEPVVTDIYSNLTNKKINEFGLIVHPEYEWLGASPDGITSDGVMIEIKCPFRRKITGIPPLYYWIQVQLQLEVCNLEDCDFVEYEFIEFLSSDEFLDDKTLDIKIFNKGLFVKLERKKDQNIPCPPEEIEYYYPPKEYLDNVDKLFNWRDEKYEELNQKYIEDNLTEIKVVYWKVCDKSIVRIKRDKKWFKNVLPVLWREWGYILYYKKEDNYKKLLTKQKEYHEGGTLILDEDCNNKKKEYIFTDSENES